jgi:hypothetical protein
VRRFEAAFLFGLIALVGWYFRPGPDPLSGRSFQSLQFYRGEYRREFQGRAAVFEQERGSYCVRGKRVYLDSKRPGPNRFDIQTDPQTGRLELHPPRNPLAILRKIPDYEIGVQNFHPTPWTGQRLSVHRVWPGMPLHDFEQRAKWQKWSSPDYRWKGRPTTCYCYPYDRTSSYYVVDQQVVAVYGRLLEVAPQGSDPALEIGGDHWTVSDLMAFFQETPKWTQDETLWTASFRCGLSVTVDWDSDSRGPQAPNKESNANMSFLLEVQ